MRVIAAVTGLLLVWLAEVGVAESYGEIRERRPDLFHPETGYRIARHRAPVPDDIPMPVRRVSALRARMLLDRGALALDVYGASQSRFDELDGTWLVSEPRMSLPGAVWLPEVGRGVLEPVIEHYLQLELERATGGKKALAIVVFCVADCWMSWNAAQRIAAMGYSQVHWYPHGTDGWADLGWRLDPVEPVPVAVQ